MPTDTPHDGTDHAIRKVAQRLLHDIDQEEWSWRFTLRIARLFWLSMRLIIFIGLWVTAVVATFAATMPSDHKGPWPWITFAIASFTAVAAQTIRDTRAFEYFQYRLKGWAILDDLRLRSGARFAQAQESVETGGLKGDLGRRPREGRLGKAAGEAVWSRRRASPRSVAWLGPNKPLQPTASSVRSCVAPAFGRSLSAGVRHQKHHGFPRKSAK